MGAPLSRARASRGSKAEKLRRELEKRGLSIVVSGDSKGERITIVRNAKAPQLDRAVTLPCLVEDDMEKQTSEPHRHTWVGPKRAWSNHD